MRSLSLVEQPNAPTPRTERIQEEQRVSQLFLAAFSNSLEESKQGDIPYSAHTVSTIKASEQVSQLMDQLGENEATYIEVTDVSGVHRKNMLAIRRSDGTESILTIFCLHLDDAELTTARVYQEIADTSEAFSAQFDIVFDPSSVGLVDYMHTSRVGRFYDREDSYSTKKWSKKDREADKKEALKLLDKIVDTSAAESVDKVVSTSITREEDRIRAHLQGKSAVRALASAVIHFPDFYRQQKEAA